MAIIARRRGDLFYGRGLVRVSDQLHDLVVDAIEKLFPEIRKISRKMLEFLASSDGVVVIGKGKVVLDAVIDRIDSQTGQVLVRVGLPLYGRQSSVDLLLKDLIDRLSIKSASVDGGRLSIEFSLDDDYPVEIVFPKNGNGNGQKSFALLSEFSGIEPK